jgi:hypothetical protein
VKLILSLSLATRMILVALVIGFVVGTVAGYRAGTPGTAGDAQSGQPGDVRALSTPIENLASRCSK